MTSNVLRHRVCVAATLAATLAGSVALGAIEAENPLAALELPVAGAGQTVVSGDFSLLAWVRPTALPEEGEANIFHIDGGPRLRLLSDGSIRAAIANAIDGPIELSATTDVALHCPQQWMLIAMSFRTEDGSIDVWAQSENGQLQTAHAATPGYKPGLVGPSIHIGRVDEIPAMVGLYGLIALRDHPIAATDFFDIWTCRFHHGPYSLDNTSTGGAMNGPNGCRWMVNHAMTTRPIDGGAGGTPHDWAALVDEPVTLFNFHVYDITEPSGSSLRAVRRVIDAAGFIHRSPYEFPAIDRSAFFARKLPDVSSMFPSSPHHVSRVSPKARLLATDLPQGIGHIRVLASSNSRGVQARDGSFGGSGNYIHGFIYNNLDRAAGVLNRPARLEAVPWFGFDATHHNARIEGDVVDLHQNDFSRFWTSSHASASPGPGEGLLLKTGSIYTLRCQPQGMMHADQPLLIQAHLLRFPGASNVRYTPNKHIQQGQAGIDVGPSKTLVLDTQTWSHLLNTESGDQVISSSRIALAGDLTSLIAIGDACSSGGGAISVIANAHYDGQHTIIDFEHPFITPPNDGSVLRFGPWQYTTVWHLWPALNKSDPAVWRGLEIAAVGEGEGVVLFSFDAWRPNVDGFLFAAGGWAGQGYTPQISRSFSGVTAAWAAQLNIDVWLMMFATQQSHPSSLDTFSSHVRAGLADVEILWLGDVIHLSSWDDELWHWWAVTQASKNNVLSSTLMLHPQLGDMLDLYADGLRSDQLHLAQRGNQRVAELWTQIMLEAALPGPLPKPGDLDKNNVIDASDLMILLSQWGRCDNPNTCAADINGDGAVDLSDLLILMLSYG